MAPTDWPLFYEALTPYFQDSFALWHLATDVAAAQHQAALAFEKLINDEDENALFDEHCLWCSGPKRASSGLMPESFVRCGKFGERQQGERCEERPSTGTRPVPSRPTAKSVGFRI